MMHRTSAFFRRVAFGLALLQYALQGAFVIADGRAAQAGERVAHIEAQGAKCPRIHTDDCVICQFIAHGTAPIAGPIWEPPAPGEVRVSAPAEAYHVAPFRPHTALLARAPPAVAPSADVITPSRA